MEYGNLAYKLPEQYDEPIKKRKPQKRKEKTVNTTAVSNKRNHEQMQYKRTIFRGICVTVLLAVSAGFMISKFVAVNEMNQQVASLKSQLTTLESATSQMVFDLEQSVDLTKIEKEATTRLGMQRPEKYQTIYVKNMNYKHWKKDDMTEKTAGEVEGFGHGIVSVLKKIGGNIVQFFSIK